MTRTLSAGLALLLLASAVSAEPPTLDVWPGKPPGETGGVAEEKTTSNKVAGKPIRILHNVTRPTLTVYRAPQDKDTGVAVLICPGGGYNILADEHEGEEVATWLNSLGVTGILLKYRVPRRKDLPMHQPPLQDTQRALSLLRSRHKEWGIDPQRLGILGFSAGGHLTAVTATNFDRRAYEPLDDIDKTSCRPDFAVLIYPAYLVGKDGQLVPEVRVTAKTPPCFFAHASNDGIGPENSIAMYRALHQAGVGAEMHLYATGGHGFGMRVTDHPCNTWPQRCADWFKDRGLLK